MNLGTRIGLYVILGLCAVLFGQRFYSEYSRMMGSRTTQGSTDLENVRLPGERSAATETANKTVDKTESRLGIYAGLFFVVVVIAGLLVAQDIARYFGNRALKVLYNDDGDGVTDPEYEKAEQEWANGNHLEAIRLMREYLAKNPREQHVALRIAEIYEKDLQNHLASALEYEDVLTKKLSPERWGWAAIHLCNLYNSKLGQPDKAIALLRRIDAEYPQTAAAEKARKRLAEIDGTPIASDAGAAPEPGEDLPQVAPPPAAPEPNPGSGGLPPGFSRKKR